MRRGVRGRDNVRSVCLSLGRGEHGKCERHLRGSTRGRPHEQLKRDLDSISNLCSARRISHPCAFRISESGEAFRLTGMRD